MPGKGLVGLGWGQWRGCTDLVPPSARKTSVAQPARSVETPTASALTASQVSAGQAGGGADVHLGASGDLVPTASPYQTPSQLLSLTHPF